MLFENYSLSSSKPSSKNSKIYSKESTKNKCVYFNEVISDNENQVKNEKRSHTYNIDGTRPRHGHKYTKYKIKNA